MEGALLLAAAACGDAIAAERLLEGGAHPSPTNANLSTPLHIAAGRGDEAVLHLLLHAGAAVNAREDVGVGGFTPLHYAVLGCHVEAVEVLLAAGANPSVADTSMGFAPLHHVAKMTSAAALDVAKVLVARGADVNFRDVHGANASHWAQLHGNTAFLGLAGIPEPSEALAEEVAEAFLMDNAAAVKGKTGLLALPARSGKKTSGKKKKKGKKKK